MKTSCMKLVIAAAALAVVCSCAGMNTFSGSFGGFRQVDAVGADFEKFAVNTGYNYYTYGSSDYPDVLLGLDNKYKLEPGVFTQVPMTPALMKSLVVSMQHRASSNGDTLRGFQVVDEKGEVIGTWYGPFMFRSVVRVRDGVVSISYPDFPNRPFGKPEPESDVN